METKTRNKVYPLAMTAVMAAVICVLGPLSIPVGPVPISFTNFAIYITLYVLGWKRGTVSYLVLRRPGQAGRPNGRLYRRFHPHGGDRRPCDR